MSGKINNSGEKMCRSAVACVVVHLIFFIFINSTVVPVDGLFQKYSSLISDINEHYSTSSVCLVRFDQNRDLRAYTLAYEMLWQFSRKGILSTAIHSEELADRMNNYYNRQVQRPMVVAMLTTVDDINNFHKLVQTMVVSYPVWLMIFNGDYDPVVCEYCKKPPKNIFHLYFDTEMIIVCCHNPILTEWWAVRKNNTEIAEFGKWTEMDGLNVTAKTNLHDRRPTVNGTGFRLALVTNSIFYTREGGSIGGLFGAVLTELRNVMDFEISKIIRADRFGTYDSARKEWSGVIELVVNGEADLGIAEFSLTTERLAFVDFTLPLILTQTQVYFKELDSSGVQWLAHFKAFRHQVWLATIVLIITSTIMMACIKTKTRVNLFFHFLLQSFVNIWGAVLWQGSDGMPAETSLKIIYFSMSIMSVVLLNIYSASLISFLTVTTVTSPFSSLEEFVNDGSYGLIAVRDSSELEMLASSQDPTISKMKRLLRPERFLPRNLLEGFDLMKCFSVNGKYPKFILKVCSQKVGFLMDEALLKILNITLPCKIVKIGTGSIDCLGMILPHHSQYTSVINHHIQRFRENGLLRRLNDIYLTEPVLPETSYTIVTLWGVAPIFSVLAGGIIFALIFYTCEKLLNRKNRSTRSRSRSNFFPQSN